MQMERGQPSAGGQKQCKEAGANANEQYTQCIRCMYSTRQKHSDEIMCARKKLNASKHGRYNGGTWPIQWWQPAVLLTKLIRACIDSIYASIDRFVCGSHKLQPEYTVCKSRMRIKCRHYSDMELFPAIEKPEHSLAVR